MAEATHVPGLRYVVDATPGIRRRAAGKGFSYTDPDGNRVGDPDELARIKKIVVPPAWTDVWICPAANGHIQATGRDARGRKQYRYHPRWREVRDGSKFERTVAFGDTLAGLRRRIRKDMATTGLPKEKVVATVVALLDCCFARIGNESYARSNGTFGLTTLRSRHARFDGSTLRLRYRGKAGKWHDAYIDDRRIVHIVRKCQDVPGQELFQYIDAEGNGVPVGSSDVNDYLREVTAEDFTAKDFRTWAGTVIAARELMGHAPRSSGSMRQHRVVAAIDAVAQDLGNTRAVCRASYVHPEVIDGYLDGSLHRYAERRPLQHNGSHGLRADERFVLSFLKNRPRGTKRAA